MFDEKFTITYPNLAIFWHANLSWQYEKQGDNCHDMIWHDLTWIVMTWHGVSWLDRTTHVHTWADNMRNEGIIAMTWLDITWLGLSWLDMAFHGLTWQYEKQGENRHKVHTWADNMGNEGIISMIWLLIIRFKRNFQGIIIWI